MGNSNYLRPSQPTGPQSIKRPTNSHGPATSAAKRQGTPTRTGGTVPQPTPNRIFADGAKFSAANTAYNTAKGNLGKGFVRNPQSKTGWSWVDDLGRMAESRPPARGERVISLQQIQRVNPNFLKAQPAQNTGSQNQQSGVMAPWLVGFTGGNGWAQAVDGGWYHNDTGQYWKPGQPIPGQANPQAQQPTMSGDQYNSLYASLLKMFEGL